MIRYTFTTPKKYDILPDKIFIYFDEQESSETIIHRDEEGEETTETYTIWSYQRAEIDKLEKGVIVNAIIRVNFSQDEVEAIFRHKLDGTDIDEFTEFNEYAEWAKEEANRILSFNI